MSLSVRALTKSYGDKRVYISVTTSENSNIIDYKIEELINDISKAADKELNVNVIIPYGSKFSKPDSCFTACLLR